MTKNERDEAIRVIKSECYIFNMLNLDRTTIVNTALDKAVEALKQTRWIPVSERLPEVRSEVLVCYDFKGNRSVYIAELYGDGEFHGYDDEYLTSEGRKYRKAVAWMPLPEPYKAESEEEDE